MRSHKNVLVSLRASAAALALALLPCAGAQAASFEWGVHGLAQSGGNFVSPGSFYDTYSFSLQDFISVDSSVTVSTNLLPSISISDGRYSLYGFGLDAMLGTSDDVNFGPSLGWSFDGTTGSSPNLVSLTAGGYYFGVWGNAVGEFGGLYSITSNIVYSEQASPIPEPQTYALMLAGLGLLSLWSRRRR